MIRHSNNLVQEYEHAKTATYISLMPHRILSFIKWEAPPMSWVKLDTYGTKDNHGNAAVVSLERATDSGFEASPIYWYKLCLHSKVLGCLRRSRGNRFSIHCYRSGFSTSD